MPNRAFRFLHASDLHLDRPPSGLSEMPDHLRSALIDAPLRAAERMFDTAVKEQVDFVLLAGDLISLSNAGPRELAFLFEQFQRLAERGIAAYWCSGRVDPLARWPASLALPESVHRFPKERVDSRIHYRGEEPLVQILAAGANAKRTVRAEGFHTDDQQDQELFTIALTYGSAEADALAAQPVHYWALGGEHARRTLFASGSVAHYCGSPQGRRPRESGAHGCTLVQVDEDRRIRTSFVPCDAMRWHQERLAVSEATTRDQLDRLLHERALALAGGNSGQDMLVTWTVAGSAAITMELRRGRLAAELTARLRADHGQRRPVVWSVAVEGEGSCEPPAELYEQDTLLGEFLRTVRQHKLGDGEPIDLEPFLAERHLAGNLASALDLSEPAVRRRVLDEVALLGLDLLRGEEPRP